MVATIPEIEGEEIALYTIAEDHAIVGVSDSIFIGVLVSVEPNTSDALVATLGNCSRTANRRKGASQGIAPAARDGVAAPSPWATASEPVTILFIQAVEPSQWRR
jgi:hypothetical protein